jgi:cell division protein FtsI/penicillin-binding protein 2
VSVGFAVNATVSASDSARALSGVWSYHASLVAYRRRNSSAWSIAWAADDLAPSLSASTHLAAIVVAPRVESVTDASAERLGSYGDPGLEAIARVLEQTPPTGRAGLSVEIQTARDKPVPDSQAVVVAPGNESLTTTITAKAEEAARSAVTQHRRSSIVAIQPSTGHILAIANNDGDNDFALTTAVAPGSTGKIISSTALLAEGILTASTPVSCPAVYTVQGVSYHNDGSGSEPASTPLAYDFAQSCNNAFSQWWTNAADGRLAAAAKKYYGLDQPWDIGIGQSATYYDQPTGASGSELAENMFGEGAITATPLAMASVAATVESGAFRQPIVVAGARQITATPLPAAVHSQLREMMRDVVTEGTAAGLGFGPDVYAKTGTADIDGQGQPNSWFVAFDPSQDVAVACLVVDAGYGAQYAAPEVRQFLSQY